MLLLLFFWATPLQCILVMEQYLHSGQRRFLEAILTHPVFFGHGIIALSLPWLVGVWALMVLLSIPMGSRLLDHLKPDPRRNRYVGLFYVRALIYFGFGILCLGWYGSALGMFTSLWPQ